MADEVRRMDIAEFRELGYLQEINRRFLHPLGLALEVVRDDVTGEERLGGVWDERADPEGISYGGEYEAGLAAKAAFVDAEWKARAAARVAALGFMVQPVEGGLDA